MHIFHIPSGFPTRHEAVAGISARDFIHTFSKAYPDTQHTVSLFYETAFKLLFKKKKSWGELVKYISKDSKTEINEIAQNLVYCHAKKSIIYSFKLGYNEKKHWLKSHRSNLEYIIKKSGKPDIIHAQFTFLGGWVAWKLAKEYSIPYIITERWGPFPSARFLKKDANELFDDIYFPMKEALALVSVSETHATDIKKYVNRDVLIIHNLIDEDLFVPILQKKKDDEFTFTTITSTYQPNKGIEDLLGAISILKKKGIIAKFIIGGGTQDNDFRRIKKIAEGLDIEKEIQWKDKLNRKEVASEIQQCDCFVSPSIYESFGLVCLEAIACGKPVIATKSGGPQSIINETNGLLVDIKNPVMLADAMEQMIKFSSKYDPEKIRQNFIDKFSKKVITDQYYQLYNSILSKY